MFSLKCFRRFVIQRFTSAEEECFKDSLEPQLIRAAIFGIISIELPYYVGFYFRLRVEVTSEDKAFVWSVGDLRTPYFVGALLLLFAANVVKFIGLFRLKTERLQVLNFEYILVGLIVYALVYIPLGNQHYAAILAGEDVHAVWENIVHPHDSLTGTFVQLNLIILMVGLFLPIRTCSLCIIPFPTIAVWSTLLVTTPGLYTSWPVLLVAIPLAWFFAYTGAYRFERHARDQYILGLGLAQSQRRVKEQELELSESSALAKGMMDVAQVLCDVVLQLTNDLLVFRSSVVLDVACGEPFTSVLAVGDHKRFSELMQRAEASGVPQCTPITLDQRFGSRDAHLLVVSTGGVQRHFCIGLRFEKDVIPASVPSISVPLNALLRVPESSEILDSEISFAVSQSTHLVRTATSEVGTQTQDDGLSSEVPCFGSGSRLTSSTQTSMVWSFDHSVCARCASRPPIVPKLAGVTRNASSNSTSSSGTSSGRRRGSRSRRRQSSDRPSIAVREMSSTAHEALNSIILIGRQEKWIVDTTSVDLMPCSALYVGGYSYVTIVNFQGASLAMKSPRVSGQGVSTDKLPFIGNSLRAFQQLKHPNICVFHGVCIDMVGSEMSWLLQLVNGTPLDKFIRSYQVSLGDEGRLEIISGMCSALRYLSVQSPCIVHGELQPSKFLIDWGVGLPCAMLLDCGWSRLLMSRPKRLNESLRWVAPELLRSPGSLPTKQADVFSFGRLSYLVVSGRVPLQDFDQHMLLEALQMTSVSGMGSLDWVDVASPFARACRAVITLCSSEDMRRRPDFAAVHEDICQLRRNWNPLVLLEV